MERTPWADVDAHIKATTPQYQRGAGMGDLREKCEKCGHPKGTHRCSQRGDVDANCHIVGCVCPKFVARQALQEQSGE